MGGSDRPRPVATPTFRPSPQQTRALIERAKRHPLGTDFLLHGSLDAVAATFQVHAFVVDAARVALGGPEARSAAPRLATGAPA